MPPESAALLAAVGRPVPSSGWTSWAPDVIEVAEVVDTAEPEASLGLVGGVLSLLMWGCASLMAVWYL
jgi:hypothetical protein